MRDFNNVELSVGDEVIFITPSYRDFTIGTILSFTEKTINIEYRNTWNYSGEGLLKKIKQLPNQVIKTEKI